MKHHVIALCLLLSACGGFPSQEKFLQDHGNADMQDKIITQIERTSDCDKLGQLYEFAQKDNPSTDDLEKILPLLGISQGDFNNYDKIYDVAVNSDIIDSYNCNDNRTKLYKTADDYCRNKYYDEYDIETAIYFPFRLVTTASVFTFVGAIPFAMHSCGIESAWHPIACHRKQDCEKYLTQSLNASGKDYTNINKNKLKEKIKERITQIYPIPYIDSFEGFSINELIAADKTIIGECHGYEPICSRSHCVMSIVNGEYSQHCEPREKNIATQIDVIKVLQSTCEHNYISILYNTKNTAIFAKMVRVR